MRTLTKMMTVLTLSATVLSTPLAAGLADEKRINDKLFVFAIANEIRKACDDISPRMLRALSFRNDLYAQARGKGYTNKQIDAYINNKAEQRKMKSRGNAYLKQFGASLSDKPSLCRVGRAEIKKRSQIGSLLRAK